MTALKTLLRRLRTLLWTAFSILVILAAVLVGIGKLMMPYSDRYQPRLEAWLSEEFGRPVVLESFHGEWTAFGPRLSLRGLKLLPDGRDEDGEAVAIESAALDIRPLNALIPGRPHYNFRIIGADFELRHTAQGRLELSGFGVSGRGGGSGLAELARVGEVVLEDSSLVYQDEKYGILLGFKEIQGRLHLDGDDFSTEIRASFHDARSGLVYGEVETTILLTLDDDQRLVNIAWQATAREIMLAAFQGRLPRNPFQPLTGWLNADLWGSWSRDDGHRARGIADLSEARLVNDHQDLQLDRVNTRFRWHFSDTGQWELHLADFLFDDGLQSWTAPRVSIARNTAADLGLWISSDRLPLGVPASLARDIMSIYDTPWPTFLPGVVSGTVEDLNLVLNARWRVRMAEGSVRGASIGEWGRWPALRGVNADVSLHDGSGLLRLDSETLDVDWPRMFREPLSLAMPFCNVDLRWGGRWQVGFSNCRLENEDLAVQGDVSIRKDEGKPAVDVNVALTHGRIDRLAPYWPEAIMKENIKAWLRRGLKGGELSYGRFLIHGDMDDWPFREGKGRFEAMAKIVNGRIDYLDGWPEAGGVDATVRFEGASMTAEGAIADLGGLQSDAVRVRIDEMKRPVLEIDYRADTNLPQIRDFLEQTPLREQIQVDLSQFTFAGEAQTEGRLAVPLGAAEGELSLDGRLTVPDGYFSDPVSDITLEHIRGELGYDEDGFRGSDLEAEFRGYAAQLDLTGGTGSEEKFRADMVGVFGVRDVIPAFLLESYAELAKVDGACLWNASLTVTSDENADEALTVFRVESGLNGVDLDLPAPLRKPAGESWPLVFRYPISGAEQFIDVEFVDRATLRFDLSDDADSPLRSVIRLGGGMPPMPGRGFIRIEGESEMIDLDGWIDVIIDGALGGRGMGGLDLEKGSLQADKLLFLDRIFDDVAMEFEVEDDDIRGSFAAAEIDGKVRFTSGESGLNSLSAEFERLVLGEPESAGLDVETDPADLPALHLYARSFSYLGVELGETRIEAFPTAGGFQFEMVDARSDQLSVQASGDWTLTEEGQRSDFEINMASESLGDFLRTLDISSSVEGGQTLVQFSAWWPGSPAAFALSRLNGEIEFSVVDGNITNASAGSGRLLGLLSIQALPKRLSLDFRDVFDAGFSFDEASGTFRMENGTATTDDMLLESSAANIMVAGSTDLVEQRYDQLMTIRPGLGNTLPIIGVLAGGPAGAAAGLALQGLLQKPLAEASQVQYTITGDWDDPVIEAVDVREAKKETPRVSR